MLGELRHGWIMLGYAGLYDVSHPLGLVGLAGLGSNYLKCVLVHSQSPAMDGLRTDRSPPAAIRYIFIISVWPSNIAWPMVLGGFIIICFHHSWDDMPKEIEVLFNNHKTMGKACLDIFYTIMCG